MSTATAPQELTIRQTVTSLVEQAEWIDAVVTAPQAEEAAELLVALKAQAKRIEDYWKPKVDAAHQAHKQLTAARSEMTKPLVDAAKRIKGLVDTYQTAILAEQRKREKEAREKAEAEAREILAKAEKLREEGRAEEATDVLNTEYTDAAHRMNAAAATVSAAAGTHTRESWDFAVADLNAVPREWLVLDEKRVREHIKRHKDAANDPANPAHIPGIMAVMRASTVVG